MNDTNATMQPGICGSHAKLSEDTALISQKVDTIDIDVKKVLKLLQGNGGTGLVTDIALIQADLQTKAPQGDVDILKTIQSKVWKFLIIIGTGLIGIAFFVIRKSLS